MKKIAPVLLLCLFAILLHMPQHADAQCQLPSNLSPEKSKTLAWADFLDTAARQVVLRLNEIRANPRSYGQNVLLPHVKSKKEYYTDPNAVEGLTSTHSKYKIDKCEKKIYETHTLQGQDVANANMKEKIATLDLANNTSPQKSITPCVELTTSTQEYGKFYLQLLSEGMNAEDISNYEQCHGKAPIRRDWGLMPVVQFRLYQGKNESVSEFVDRLLSELENFKDWIAAPYCTMGLSRFEYSGGGYVWFIYCSNKPGHPEYAAKPHKKT